LAARYGDVRPRSRLRLVFTKATGDRITLDIYSPVMPAMQTNAADTVAALVLGEPGYESISKRLLEKSR
jgi:hypothetical protein